MGRKLTDCGNIKKQTTCSRPSEVATVIPNSVLGSTDIATTVKFRPRRKDFDSHMK